MPARAATSRSARTSAIPRSGGLFGARAGNAPVLFTVCHPDRVQPDDGTPAATDRHRHHLDAKRGEPVSASRSEFPDPPTHFVARGAAVRGLPVLAEVREVGGL